MNYVHCVDYSTLYTVQCTDRGDVYIIHPIRVYPDQSPV